VGGVLVSAIIVFLVRDVDQDLKSALGTAFRGLVVESVIATLIESVIFLLGIFVIRLVIRRRLDASHASAAFWIAGGARVLEYGWSSYVRWGLKLGGEDFSHLLLVDMFLLPLLSAVLFAVVALRRQARA